MTVFHSYNSQRVIGLLLFQKAVEERFGSDLWPAELSLQHQFHARRCQVNGNPPPHLFSKQPLYAQEARVQRPGISFQEPSLIPQMLVIAIPLPHLLSFHEPVAYWR